ncbi:glycerophosphoryl diester phosphodiesterase [Bacteroidia bacterium]|nr:glycerophosphoryl diester phosphodiesterase [Bacteroidia bacterium]
MNMKRKFGFIFAVAWLSGALAAQNPQIVAHRGYHTIDNVAENSIASLAKAQEAGVYASECDVWLTLDGVVVVNHDSHLSGKVIQNLNYSHIQEDTLCNGEKIPKFSDYLLQAKQSPDTKLIVEIKVHDSAERNNLVVDSVIAMVQRAEIADQVEYISFDYNICKRLAEKAPANLTGYLTGDKAPKKVFRDGIKSIDYHISVYRKHSKWIKQAHKLGMVVNVWTVNLEQDMDDCIRWGVEYITTDFPLILKLKYKE